MKLVSRIARSTALAGVVASPGCFLSGYDGVFIERDDVTMEYGGNGFRAAGEEGDVYKIIEETAQNVNGWVGETVQGVSSVVAYLNNYRETSKDGEWRVYGPFNDDQDRDLAWLVKITGDDTATDYEVWVGARGASQGDTQRLVAGSMKVEGEVRTGTFSLYFDAVEAHPAMKDLENAAVTFSGSVDVTFERDTATDRKLVGLQFNDFRAEDVLGQAWFSDESYTYDRDADGGGTFHLAVYGTFDDNAWGGTQTNKLELDARWNPDEAGRTRGQILQVENEESILDKGDMIIHECFAGTGGLTWRWISDAYAAEMPEYVFGDESSCVFTEADLP
jgi:hypothetical protein